MGRARFTQAVKLIAQDVLDAKINLAISQRNWLGNTSYVGHLPKVRDPDLIIRPAVNCLSNFLPGRLPYIASSHFTDVLWPDFDERKPWKKLISSTIVATVVLEEFLGRYYYDTGFTKENPFAILALAIFLSQSWRLRLMAQIAMGICSCFCAGSMSCFVWRG